MRLLAALFVLIATGSAAQISGEGHFYETTCTASGYVLTSSHPVARFFGTGAATTITQTRETLYLGRSCDAARTGWSGGTWCWANGGFRVDFAEYGIGFPRQEVVCPAAGPQIDLLSLDCSCK